MYTTKDVGEGTGLGLSISHHIVSAHGGRIEVDSKPGEGTCFRVHLPLKEPRTQP
jgi:two-component system NtrC family sensor kinase